MNHSNRVVCAILIGCSVAQTYATSSADAAPSKIDYSNEINAAARNGKPPVRLYKRKKALHVHAHSHPLIKAK